MQSWLQLHELMASDLPALEHHIVIQYEYMSIAPSPIINALKGILGWNNISYIGEYIYIYCHR